MSKKATEHVYDSKSIGQNVSQKDHFDFIQAFPKVKRAPLWALMEGAGFPREYISYRSSIYSPKGNGSDIPITDVVFQGRAIAGPSMYDGLIQGLRSSCLSLAFVMEASVREWIRIVLCYDIYIQQHLLDSGRYSSNHPPRGMGSL